jgi:hypothetical protein
MSDDYLLKKTKEKFPKSKIVNRIPTVTGKNRVKTSMGQCCHEGWVL